MLYRFSTNCFMQHLSKYWILAKCQPIQQKCSYIAWLYSVSYTLMRVQVFQRTITQFFKGKKKISNFTILIVSSFLLRRHDLWINIARAHISWFHSGSSVMYIKGHVMKINRSSGFLKIMRNEDLSLIWKYTKNGIFLTI